LNRSIFRVSIPPPVAVTNFTLSPLFSFYIGYNIVVFFRAIFTDNRKIIVTTFESF
jgi:hypothetical protein